jgi:hypothetical protein
MNTHTTSANGLLTDASLDRVAAGLSTPDEPTTTRRSFWDRLVQHKEARKARYGSTPALSDESLSRVAGGIEMDSGTKLLNTIYGPSFRPSRLRPC